MSGVIQPPARLAYRVPEAAEALGVCRATVYNLISRGDISVVKIGRATRVPASELRRIAGATVPGDAQ